MENRLALAAFVLSALTFAVLALNTLTSYFKPRAAAAQDEKLASMSPNVLTPDKRESFEHRFTEMESALKFLNVSETLQRLATLEAQITPFLRVIEVEMGRRYHSPHTPDFDLLIEQNETSEGLSLDKARDFINGIKELAVDAKSPGEEALLLMWLAASAAKYAAKYRVAVEELAQL